MKFWHQKLQSCGLGLKFFGAKILEKMLPQNVDETIPVRENARTQLKC